MLLRGGRAGAGDSSVTAAAVLGRWRGGRYIEAHSLVAERLPRQMLASDWSKGGRLFLHAICITGLCPARFVALRKEPVEAIIPAVPTIQYPTHTPKGRRETNNPPPNLIIVAEMYYTCVRERTG